MAAPKNFYNTVDQKKLGLDEALKKIDSLEGLPEVTVSDAGKVLTVSEEGKWIPFDAPQGDSWGDITWDKELIESWDFTKSLEGSAGDSFIITAGASRTDAGIVFDGTAPTVSCDLKNLISDWLEIGIHMECEYDNWGSGALTQLSFFGCDGALFEMYNSAPYNQVFPRDFYTPTINQKMIFRDIYLDSYHGLYSFNRYMAGSGSTTSLFTKFNTQIRDSDKLFLLGGYNNYGTPPEGFTITKLEFYRRISGGET